MANVFNMSNERVRDVNRNTFDLSFKYSSTFKFGALYPVFCKEVLSGDSWRIDPTFGFEFMPLVFPVQTQMRANLHFFYVRNRNLWSDYKDFFGALKENLDPPYIDYSTNFNNYAKTGSLGDYMGLPTTTSGALTEPIEKDGVEFFASNFNVEGTVTTPATIPFITFEDAWRYFTEEYYIYNPVRSPDSFLTDEPVMSCQFVQSDSFTFDQVSKGMYIDVALIYTGDRFDFTDESFIFRLCFQYRYKDSSGVDHYDYVFVPFTLRDNLYDDLPSGFTINKSFYPESKSYRLTIFLNDTFLSRFSESTNILAKCECYLPSNTGGNWSNPNNCDIIAPDGISSLFVFDADFYSNSDELVDIDESNCPFYGSKFDEPESRLKISALPFRAYESIYNAFYRDSRNNPLIIDGQPEYNKYITTDAGGVDQTPYKLRYRNWESDFLTTAVQSPQQGVAPLVGITTRGDMRFMDQESGNVYTAKANVGEDGTTIESYTVMTPTMPEGNLVALADMVSSGISINDFRNVNALQVWLETNMRKGMSFKDLIKGHFNVDVRFDELDMPEFIGGFSRDVNVQSVTQTSSDVPDSPLGSYAGQASCFGMSGNAVTHFCDEPGYIIGILSIVPVPAYSQLLPKHFIKRNTLDYYSPEFGHVGFVPIKYSEVCPVQAFSMGSDHLNDTFGYQRAWYDYLASTDEIHGLFRTSLKNYMMTRTFRLPPDLSESFLLVDPFQLNEVFASTTSNDDKILGQIYYDVSVKRPIPRFGTPRLEA